MTGKYNSISGKIYFIFNVKYPKSSRNLLIALIICILLSVIGLFLFVTAPRPDVTEGIGAIVPFFIFLCLLTIPIVPVLFVIKLIEVIGTWIYVNSNGK